MFTAVDSEEVQWLLGFYKPKDFFSVGSLREGKGRLREEKVLKGSYRVQIADQSK